MRIPSNFKDPNLSHQSTANGHHGQRRHEASRLFSDKAWSAIQESLKLSAREIEITRYIFADCQEKAIAEQLSLSPHTVRTYCERLYRKLNVNSRVEMVVTIMDQFLHLTEDPRQLLRPFCAMQRVGRCPFYA